jgi:hypothetical protein
MNDIDWIPDPRPVAPELANPHTHALFTPPVVWMSWEDKLCGLTTARLLELAKNVR